LSFGLKADWAKAQSIIYLNQPQFGKLDLSGKAEIWLAPEESSWAESSAVVESEFRPITSDDLLRMNRRVGWFRFTLFNQTSEELKLTLLTEALFYPSAFYA